MPLTYGWELGENVLDIARVLGLLEFSEEDEEDYGIDEYRSLSEDEKKEVRERHVSDMEEFYSGSECCCQEFHESIEKFGVCVYQDQYDTKFYLNLLDEEMFSVDPEKLPKVSDELKDVIEKTFGKYVTPKIFFYDDKY